MGDFKRFVESWLQATADNYTVLHVLADYVDEHPAEWKSWFQQFKNVVVDFSRKVEAYQQRITSVGWIDELEYDPLDSLENWLNLHVLDAIHRVLDDALAHNGPLFSVANAMKNTYVDVSRLLVRNEAPNYYQSPDGDHQGVIDKINRDTHSLLRSCLDFLRGIFPVFLRVAQHRWKTSSNPKQSFERLRTVFNDYLK